MGFKNRIITTICLIAIFSSNFCYLPNASASTTELKKATAPKTQVLEKKTQPANTSEVIQLKPKEKTPATVENVQNIIQKLEKKKTKTPATQPPTTTTPTIDNVKEIIDQIKENTKNTQTQNAITEGEITYEGTLKPTKSKGVKADADLANGAFTIQYPIEVPPGRNGIQPDLALNYSSQDEDLDSIMEMGWSLNIPYIKRLNKKGLNKIYDSFDFSSSMGGELVLIDGAYGGNNSKYGAKFENGEFLSYVYKTPGDYWEVTDKQGTKYKFGEVGESKQADPNNASHVYKWVLTEVRDTNDNFIKYSYYPNQDGQIYPNSILYTGSGASNGLFIISFPSYYEIWGSHRIQYSYGFPSTTNWRMGSIWISEGTNSNWKRKYDLTYIRREGDDSLVWLLSKITESASTGGDSGTITTMSPDEFIYKNNVGKKSWVNSPSYVPTVRITNTYCASSDSDGNGVRFADVNGDGYTDIIQSKGSDYAGDPSVNQVLINNKDNRDGGGWWLDSRYSVPVYFEQSVCRQNKGARIADINGDMLPDIIEDRGGGQLPDVYLNKGNTGTPGWELASYKLPAPLLSSFDGSDVGVRFADINGDGLVDIVGATTSPTNAYLNLGGGDWEPLSVYMPLTFTNPGTLIEDVNGDNLADLIYGADIGGSVYINNGFSKNTGSPITLWELSNYIIPKPLTRDGGKDNGVRFVDINGDNLKDIIYSRTPGDQENKVWINTGDGSWKEDTSYQKVPIGISITTTRSSEIFDANGDGIEDLLVDPGNANGSGIEMHLGQTEKPNIISQYNKRHGGKVKVTYKPSTKGHTTAEGNPNWQLPLILTTVANIKINDGSQDVMDNNYIFSGGLYYYGHYKGLLERKFAGFSNAIRTDNISGFIYRNLYYQGMGTFGGSFDTMGKLYCSESMYDALGFSTLGVSYKWESVDVGNKVFTKLKQKVTAEYADSYMNHKGVQYTYNNSNGNTTKIEDFGSVDTSFECTQQGFTSGTDKYTTDISYAQDLQNGKIIGLPSKEIVYDDSGNKIKENQYYYDNQVLGNVTKGNLTTEKNWKSGNEYISNSKTYNSYGLVASETDGNGNTTSYEYDQYNLYPTSIRNALSQVTEYLYDYSSGKMIESTDPNGSKWKMTLDTFDRPLEEYVSNPEGTGLVKTANYYYGDYYYPSIFVSKTTYLSNSNNNYQITYLDGLDRAVQDRKNIQDSNTYSVRDFKYDNAGLLKAESLPYISSTGAKTNPTTQSSLYINYAYDILARLTSKSSVFGTEANNYQFYGSNQKIINTNEEGKIKTVYKDPRDNIVKITERNAGTDYETSYSYNYDGNLTRITDANGNIRNFTYDGIGRKIYSEETHAPSDTTFGTQQFTYDANGNLISGTNQENEVVNYAYDVINRIISEDYTGTAGADVTYTYDSCSVGTGRLCSVSSIASQTNYTYNNQGGVKSETGVIDGVPYPLNYIYDWQGNPTSITYPDDSKVDYGYNTIGELKTVKYNNANVITNIDYAPTGDMKKIEYADGTYTENTYDNTKQYRLTNKKTKKGTSILQDASYTYSNTGNITRIIEAGSNNIKKTANYTYDDLSRLLSATVTGSVGARDYALSYVYDKIGNITSTSELGQYKYEGNLGTSYATPHAVTSVSGKNLTYDKKGNLLSDGARSFVWDYKNRLTQSTSGSTSTQYFYDANGERIKKLTGTNSTIYPNKYYEVRSDGTLRHVFLGGINVATFETLLFERLTSVSNVRLTPDVNKITVNWDVYVPANPALFSKFKIYRTTDSGAQINDSNKIAEATDVTTISYVDTSPTRDIQYYYAVKAIDINNRESDATWVGPASLAPYPLLPQVTGLSLTPTTDKITLAWSTYSGNPTRFANFEIHRATDNTQAIDNTNKINTINNIATIIYDDATAQRNTAYYYAITAIDIDGNSSGGIWVGPTSLSQYPPLPQVTGLVLTSTTDKITLTWNAYTGDATRFANFEIHRATDNTQTINDANKINTISNRATTSFDDTTAQQSTAYYYAITAIDVDGGSSGGSWKGPISRVVIQPSNSYVLAFDGVDDVVTTALSIPQKNTGPVYSVNTGYTFEAWVYPTSTSIGRHQVISTNNGGLDWSILRDGSKWYVFAGDNFYDTGFSVSINKWQHLAAVFQPGSGVVFYKDKRYVKIPHIGYDTSTGLLTIGNVPVSLNESFDGKIDEVRIWKVTRTGKQIVENMIKILVGTEANLVAYWNFDEGQGQIAKDKTGNYNATLGKTNQVENNDPTWSVVTFVWSNYVSPYSATGSTILADPDAKVGTEVDINAKQ